VGVHGSGFANFAFLSPGARAIDIVAPRHLDPYYWILCEHTGARYGYLFGKGDRPDETHDLVTSKIDRDIEVDMEALDQLFHRL
jgi:capsular polysaccharide biosynthesis protein